MNKDKWMPMAAYISVCILWGSTYLAIRIGVQDLPPMLFAGVRFLIAGALMLGYAVLARKPLPSERKDYVNISVVGLLLLLGGNGLVVTAEQWVHSSLASLIVAAVPLFMAIIEAFILRKKTIGPKGWLGLFIGFGGVFYMVWSNGLAKGVEGGIDIKGCLILLAACLSWAVGSVYSKGFKAGGSIISQIGIQMLAGGTGLTVIGLLIGEAARVHLTTSGLLAVAYLVVFGSIIGYSSYIYLLQVWPAAKAGTYAYINPVIAVILGALILNESFGLPIIISTAVILSGVVLVQQSNAAVKEPVKKVV